MTSRNDEVSQLWKFLKPIALLALAIVIAWWFGRDLNWREVRQSLTHTNWKFLTVATAIVSFTYLLRAYRWRALLKPLTEAGLRDLFVATVGGFSAVFIIGRGGEVVRPALLTLSDRRVRPAASFITIMVERICDLAAIVILFAVNLIWFNPPTGRELEFSSVREVGLGLFVAALVGLSVLFVFQRHADSVIKRLSPKLSFLPQFLNRLLISLLEQLASALRVFTSPGDLVVTVYWTGILWGAVIVANVFILRGFGVEFGVAETIFVLGWALVGSLVPTPGGAAGAFHAATAAGLVFLGATRERAAAIAIVLHLIDFAPALLFGLYFLLTGDISLTRLRHAQKIETGNVALEMPNA
jgi:uncharacterized protein (TIRG00374 family)